MNIPGSSFYWQTIWNNFRNGDTDSFKTLYEKYIDVLFAYGSKITRDRDLLKDCIHDLFIDLFRYSKTLKSADSIEFYMMMSLKRSIIKKQKFNSRFTSIKNKDKVSFDLKFNLEEQIIENETENLWLKSLQKILQSLDTSERELLFLRFRSNLNYKEIGKIVGKKPDAVKKKVYRILSQIKTGISLKIVGF